MLRRDRQLRNQIYQLKDAALFALALWVAHFCRSQFHLETLVEWMPFVGARLRELLSVEITPFEEYFWLYLVIFPGAPLALESQGYYRRPTTMSRRSTA